jgi:uncharacterized sulfatase
MHAVLGLGLAVVVTALDVRAAAVRPNILWISAEDINPNLGCYGDTFARTPALDGFARRGTVYRHCWSNAGSCAPARTAIITGVYPTSAGAEHMRSLVPISPDMRMLPHLLREAGYYRSNNSKTDYNLATPDPVWDESSPKAHWRNRPTGAPFFSVFNLTITHESRIGTPLGPAAPDPAKVPLPPCHPDTPEVRRDWARYHDNIAAMDGEFAALLSKLEADGLADDTIVFFFGDNGSGMPGHKHFASNAGLHVPLIVHVPTKFRTLVKGEYRPGSSCDRLVSFVDLAPTVLSLAGLRPPDWMQGRAFLGPHEAPPRDYLHGFRGRAGARVDFVRSVRDQRFIYVRNYLPHVPKGRTNFYSGTPATSRVWEDLFHQGSLTPAQARHWQPRQPEELHDLVADPDELVNLVGSPQHQEILSRLRRAQRDHAAAIRDVGFLPEAEMHARAAGTAPYDLARDPERYPMERIMAMAEAASGGAPGAGQRLLEGLGDGDSAVRYWAAKGLRIGGPEAVGKAIPGLRAALKDTSPIVRIAAADALACHGGDGDHARALRVLSEALAQDADGLYVRIAALDAIDLLGDRGRPAMDAIRAMPRKLKPAESRPGQALGWTADGVLKKLEATRPRQGRRDTGPQPKGNDPS